MSRKRHVQVKQIDMNLRMAKLAKAQKNAVKASDTYPQSFI